MTPFARKLIESDQVEPESASIVSSAMPFDMTEAKDLATEVSENLVQSTSIGDRGFLPDRVTWIEYRSEECTVAFLVRSLPCLKAGLIDVFRADKDGVLLSIDRGIMDLSNEFASIVVPEASSTRLELFLQRLFLASLWLVNSPTICQSFERNHARSVQKRFRKWGKYPLNTWREVKLKVGAPYYSNSSEKPGTLRRPLHRVRSYLRVQQGVLTMVKAHWRGDETLGVVRTKYKVQPGENQRVSA